MKIEIDFDERDMPGYEPLPLGSTEGELVHVRCYVRVRPKQPRRWEVEECSEDKHDGSYVNGVTPSLSGSGYVSVRIVREIQPNAATDDMKLDMGESLRGREAVKDQPICPQCGSDDPNEPRINFKLKKICDHTFHPLNKPKRKVVKFTPIRSSAMPGIGDWIQLNSGSFVQAVEGDPLSQFPRTIYQRTETEE